MKENAENEKELENENAGWMAFMELRRQAQLNMQQLSADAEKAGSAGMTLDEINAEIAAARSGKEPVTNCDHMETI